MGRRLRNDSGNSVRSPLRSALDISMPWRTCSIDPTVAPLHGHRGRRNHLALPPRTPRRTQQRRRRPDPPRPRKGGGLRKAAVGAVGCTGRLIPCPNGLALVLTLCSRTRLLGNRLPQPPASPFSVRHFWRRLAQLQRSQLVRHCDVVGIVSR